jgi:hypothetical protein
VNRPSPQCDDWLAVYEMRPDVAPGVDLGQLEWLGDRDAPYPESELDE